MTPNKLKHIRQLLGWTQERMAEETDYTRGYINNMEHGTQVISTIFVESLIAAVIKHTKNLQQAVK